MSAEEQIKDFILSNNVFIKVKYNFNDVESYILTNSIILSYDKMEDTPFITYDASFTTREMLDVEFTIDGGKTFQKFSDIITEDCQHLNKILSEI